MKYVKKFEKFTDSTLKTNIDAYNRYYNRYTNRSGKVAWEAKDSQENNFNLVSEHIKSGDSVLDYGCGLGDLISHLEKKKIQISDYLGADINQKYIEDAKKHYSDFNFKLITDIDQLSGKWDKVCAVGVFTWHIGKEEFIESIRKLIDLSEKEVLLTFLYDDDVDFESPNYWESNYRYYNEELFENLFPDLIDNFEFHNSYRTILVRIKKN